MSVEYREKDGKTFPVYWKVIHIVLYGSLFVLGLVNFIPFASITQNFQGVCPLYTNYSLTLASNNSLSVTSIKLGDQEICQFCLYTQVSSTIFAFIFAWFYALCGRGGSYSTGLPKPWRMVCPSFIFAFVFCIISLVSSVYLTNGFTFLCKCLEHNAAIEKCSTADSKEWTSHPDIKGFYVSLVIAEASSWATTSIWIITMLVLLARCCYPADFEAIHKIEDEEKKSLHEETDG